MRAKTLTDLLRQGDRVAVSNITGREAGEVTEASHCYAGNIVGGWALGKGGGQLPVEHQSSLPVFSDYADLREHLPRERHPNKIVIYSPPEAVYGEIKNVVKASLGNAETIFIITEHVSTEVSAKIHKLCRSEDIDVIGCNTLGVINVTEHVRIGAVGGDAPEETFHPGGATLISNSGNMVNTMASYLYGAGIGTRFGISTGKDQLILTPLRELLELALHDDLTQVVVLYVEPGGLYEQIAAAWMQEVGFSKPMIVYVAGTIADERNLSLGHAGAVVEGVGTRAREKMALWDAYLGVPPFAPGMSFESDRPPVRGLRIQALHDLPEAVRVLYDLLRRERDYRHYTSLRLNPWLKNMGRLAARLPPALVLSEGNVPPPYKEQIEQFHKTQFGRMTTRREMRSASHASSNDGATPRVYGRSVLRLMESQSFAYTLILAWTGHPPARPFEPELVEKTLIAALTNGPGTISAQAAKLSASAGNSPHTAMIATLATVGDVHGGNGREAVALMIDAFANSGLTDPYDAASKDLVRQKARGVAAEILRRKRTAADQDIAFQRMPCLGHPVYRNEDVNYDPREQVVARHLEEAQVYHAFLDFYHELAVAMREAGVTRNVLAVNVDAAIACVWLGVCWPLLCEKRLSVDRAKNIAVAAFALGRAAGGASEYFDHADFGLPMDMRIPVTECTSLTADVTDEQTRPNSVAAAEPT
jgi:succinyl-CoA synthetase alpha subunit/citrate synthase